MAPDPSSDNDHLEGFQFPPGGGPMAAFQHIRTMLLQYSYMPGGKKGGIIEPNFRVKTNLRMIFEAICYFSDFWGTQYFWEDICEHLNFHHNTTGPFIKQIVARYCDGRRAFRQSNPLEHFPTPLASLADTIIRLQDHGPTNKKPGRFEEQAKKWRSRQHTVLMEMRVLSNQVRDGTCATELKRDVRGNNRPTSPDNPRSDHSRSDHSPFGNSRNSLASRVTTAREPKRESSRESPRLARGPPSITRESPARMVPNRPDTRPSRSNSTSSTSNHHQMLPPAQTLDELLANHSTLPKPREGFLGPSSNGTVANATNNKRPYPAEPDEPTNPSKKPVHMKNTSVPETSKTKAGLTASPPDSTKDTGSVDIAAVIDLIGSRGKGEPLPQHTNSTGTVDFKDWTATQPDMHTKTIEAFKTPSDSGTSVGSNAATFTKTSQSADENAKALMLKAIQEARDKDPQFKKMQLMVGQQKSQIERLQGELKDTTSRMNDLENLTKRLQEQLGQQTNQERIEKIETTLGTIRTAVRKQLEQSTSNSERTGGIEALLKTVQQENAERKLAQRKSDERIDQIQGIVDSLQELHRQRSIELEPQAESLKEQKQNSANVGSLQTKLLDVQAELKSMKEHMVQQPGSTPLVRSESRDFSCLVDRDVSVFMDELSRLRSAMRAKFHKLEAAGVPDEDEEKLALASMAHDITNVLKAAKGESVPSRVTP